MRDRRPPRSRWVAATLLVCGTTLFAGTGAPLEHVSEIDGPLRVTPVALDGSAYAAWVHDGDSSTIALSRFDPARREWSAPEWLDVGSPAAAPWLEVDGAGNAYVVFADLPSAQIRVAVRPAGSEAWLPGGTVSTPGISASAPVARIVGASLVIAFLEGDVVRLVDLPIPADPPTTDSGRISTQGIQEGPDVVDPLGRWAGGSGGTGRSQDGPLRRRGQASGWGWVSGAFTPRIAEQH